MSTFNVKTCASCDAELDCSSSDCWCASYPPILPSNNSCGCLCQKCLIKKIKIEIEDYMADLTNDKIKKVQAFGKPNQFTEGIDYKINDQGAWVFSSWYLLRQGHCCGNGCLNCPYPEKMKTTK